jgi:beta-glucanase (GH16 family)
MIIPARSRLGLLSIGLALVFATQTGCAGLAGDEPKRGWVLTFSDEFDGPDIDTAKWEVLTRKDSHNEEKQYYLPEQASIVDGRLRITSTNEPYEGKAYRSARLESWHAQAYGRFEARAKIPTTKGIWPAFWLLPRTGNWPHDGEIDIMEHHGSNMEEVNCAYHFANDDGQHAYVFQSYSIKDAQGGNIRFPDGFHLYAAQWSPDELVFYVDGVEYYRVDRKAVPITDTPMSVILNTAVGGWFDGDPDGSTVFPQHFDIDYVRVYQRADWFPDAPDTAIKPKLINGDFQQGGGAWDMYTNAMVYSHDPQAVPRNIAFEGGGGRSLKLYGKFGGTQNSAAIQKRIKAKPGTSYKASAAARTNSDDSIAGTRNRCEMFIRFMDDSGGPIPGSESRMIVVDADTVADRWQTHTLTATAPVGAATLEVGFEFIQHDEEQGAAWIDQVTLDPSN